MSIASSLCDRFRKKHISNIKLVEGLKASIFHNRHLLKDIDVLWKRFSVLYKFKDNSEILFYYKTYKRVEISHN